MAAPILIAGYYGHRNAGDEAILGVLLDDVRSTHPGHPIFVVTSQPERVQANFGVETIELGDLDGLIAAAANARLLVLGGGGLLQDYRGADLANLLLPTQDSIGFYTGFAILGGLADTPVVMYGIGVGPLETEAGRHLVGIASRAAAAITVRDTPSRNLLVSLGADAGRIEVTADPAFALTPETPKLGDGRSSKLLGVSVRPWGDGGWMGELSEALDSMIETMSARVRFIPFQVSEHDHEDDLSIAKNVASLMRHPVEYADEPHAAIGDCDLVIGMRYHSVVFAALSGTPIVAIGYDPKVGQLMNQLGLADRSLDLADLNAPSLVAAVTSALDDQSLSRQLVESSGELAKRAATNREVLKVTQSLPFADRGAVVSDLLRSRVDLKREAGRWQWKAEDLERRLEKLRTENAELTSSYRELAAEHNGLLNSRALAPAQLYWRLKARFGRSTGN